MGPCSIAPGYKKGPTDVAISHTSLVSNANLTTITTYDIRYFSIGSKRFWCKPSLEFPSDHMKSLRCCALKTILMPDHLAVANIHL